MVSQNLEQYYPYVKRISWKWYNKTGEKHRSSFEIDDLFHEGLVALYKCHERFDASKGSGFWGFARIRVEGAVIDFLRQSALVRVPQKQIKKLKQLKKENDSFCNKMLREPTDEEMANALCVSVKEIHRLKVLIPTFDREEAIDRENNIEVLDIKIDMRYQLSLDVDECMENLSDNKKGILLSRKDGVPLKNLAKSLDVSIETIRRWEKQAMKNMKDCLERKEWSIEDAIQVV